MRDKAIRPTMYRIAVEAAMLGRRPEPQWGPRPEDVFTIENFINPETCRVRSEATLQGPRPSKGIKPEHTFITDNAIRPAVYKSWEEGSIRMRRTEAQRSLKPGVFPHCWEFHKSLNVQELERSSPTWAEARGRARVKDQACLHEGQWYTSYNELVLRGVPKPGPSARACLYQWEFHKAWNV